MERNQFIGIVLISVTLFLWLRTTQPTAETDAIQKGRARYIFPRK